MNSLTNKKIIETFKTNRDSLNSTFIFASGVNHRLSRDVFFEYIKELIEKNVNEFDEIYPQKTEDFILKIYYYIVELYKINLLDNKGLYPFFEDNLSKLIYYYRERIYLEPDFILIFTNPLFNIANDLKEKSDLWTKIIISLPKDIDSLLLKKISLISAWFCGYSYYRECALNYINEIDNFYLEIPIFLEVGFNYKKILRNRFNPWNGSNSNNIFVKTFGNFSGFDGFFDLPPTVFLTEDGVIATDNQNSFLVYYDCFGLMLHRVEGFDFSKKVSEEINDFSIDDTNGTLRYKGKDLNLKIGNVKPITSSVSLKNTLFFTIENSHMIYLIGIPDE